jgi:hypothetical protein
MAPARTALASKVPPGTAARGSRTAKHRDYGNQTYKLLEYQGVTRCVEQLFFLRVLPFS